jgi:hypothetical protein
VTESDNNDNDKNTVHIHEEKERLLDIPSDAGDIHQELNAIMLFATVIVKTIC